MGVKNRTLFLTNNIELWFLEKESGFGGECGDALLCSQTISEYVFSRKKDLEPQFFGVYPGSSQLILMFVGWHICQSSFYITNYCTTHVRRGFNFKTTLTIFIPQHGTHPPQSCYCRRKRLWKDIPS
jgi:hypothetical protein